MGAAYYNSSMEGPAQIMKRRRKYVGRLYSFATISKSIVTMLKKLEGNPGKRKLNKKEPVPAKGMPECPDWLLP